MTLAIPGSKKTLSSPDQPRTSPPHLPISHLSLLTWLSHISIHFWCLFSAEHISYQCVSLLADHFLGASPFRPKVAHHSSFLNKYVEGMLVSAEGTCFTPLQTFYSWRLWGSKELSNPVRTHSFWATWMTSDGGRCSPRSWRLGAGGWPQLERALVLLFTPSSGPETPLFPEISLLKQGHGRKALMQPAFSSFALWGHGHGCWVQLKPCAVSKLSGSQPSTLSCLTHRWVHCTS